MSAISRFLSYYWRSVTVYQVHSPAVYNFVTEVLDQDREYYIYAKIEYLREQYLKSTDRITFRDLGAGSKRDNQSIRKIVDIARHALSPRKTCRVLFNAVQYYDAKKIIELGSSLGISTCYLAASNDDLEVVSIEGNPDCARIARHNLHQLQLDHAQVITGSFDDHLPSVLAKWDTVDLVYLDGNHSYTATLKYFLEILPYVHSNTILIFDDIYWSDDMLKAWNEIKIHPTVSYSINIYSSGFLFFNSSMKHRQHFVLIDHKWKPWQIGIFSKIRS